MSKQPILTICVPSRNRQATFKETIASLVMNLRTDVEFIFADNSDDPAIMQGFIADVLFDPRVKFLPSADRILPMNDNWERCVEAATGAYVCVIGDDDYVDPDVADTLIRLCKQEGDVDVFVWSRLNYNWPDNRSRPANVSVPLGTGIIKVKREHLFAEFFGWRYHNSTPNCPFSIYHGAVAKRVMDANKARFGGRHFGHLTVDFETSCKLLVNAKSFYYCERPFSILGACFASNSGSVGNPAELKMRHAAIMVELGRNIDHDPYMREFPFSATLGVASAVGQVQQWFCHTYKIQRPSNWEQYFVRACAIDCRSARSEEAFKQMTEDYRMVLRRWHGGRFLKDFKPPAYEVKAEGQFFFTGIHDGTLLLDERIGNIVTPAELYHIVSQIVVAPSDMKMPGIKRKAAA